MPRISEKIKLINFLEETAVTELLTLEIFGEENQHEKYDEIFEDFAFAYTVANHFRYSVPFQHHSVPKTQNYLLDVLPNLDEKRFRQIVRVSWINFEAILGLIENDETFAGPRSCKQLPVRTQLIITLYRLGSSGEGASIAKVAGLFGIGDGGTLHNITNRVFKAILNIKDKFLYWPDAKERQDLVSSTFYELPHCVGYVDGTEIKLAEKPQEDPESYFSRKHVYSLKVQALCDHKLRIRHMVLGYPGSVHDSRMYNNCELSKNVTEYLTGAEWIAGDSAYKLTATVITPFRANSNVATLQQRTAFNKKISKYRVRIEHSFGMMKERFNSLKELKIQLKDDSSIKFSCRWILVCAILHNIILDQDNGDVFDPDYDQSSDTYENDEHDSPNENFPTVEGELKRQTLLEILNEFEE